MIDDQAVCGWGPYVDQAAGDRTIASAAQLGEDVYTLSRYGPISGLSEVPVAGLQWVSVQGKR